MGRLIIFALVMITPVALWNIFFGGSVNSVTFGYGDFVMTFDTSTTVLSALIGLGAAIALVGINILDIGLNEQGTKTLTTLIVYTTIWGGLSCFSWSAYAEIPYSLGIILWVILTIFYAAGALMEVTGEENL